MLYKGLADEETKKPLTVFEAMDLIAKGEDCICYIIVKDGKLLMQEHAQPERLIKVYQRCWEVLDSIP